MRTETIHIDQLASTLVFTFIGDDELGQYFDPAFSVSDWRECCDIIFQKIQVNYPEATIRQVIGDTKLVIGYYIFEKDILISFGIHTAYRKKEYLVPFWECIKKEFSGAFSCVLYSQNERAISWLQKAGMKILFDNVTILSSCQQED